MKSFATILLPVQLIVALLGTYDPGELSKIANLADHYRHHVHEHGETNLTILDFLIDHFAGDHAADDEHHALPLLGGGATPVMAIEIHRPSCNLQLPLVDVPVSPLNDADGSTQRSVPEIFQPPRIG
jgi:hypothetical protein